MKRVYKNNDIKFNLTINDFPFIPEAVDNILFKFYTKNKNNYILKTKEDIVDKQIVLEWKDLAKLERGVLNYSYNVGVSYPEMSDNEFNTVSDIVTDYYIMSDITDIDIDVAVAEWGKINGDIEKQLDLVDYIDLKIKNINIADYAKKTDLPTKTSQLTNDSGFLTEHQDITGKLDKSVYELEKVNFATKAEIPDISGKLDKSVYESEKTNFATKAEIPTKTSQLTNDSGYLTEHQDITSKLDKSVYESEKTNFATKAEIPTKTSQLTNDSGYLTEHQDISGKLDKSVYDSEKADFATKTELTSKQDKLVSGVNISTINDQDITKGGNIVIEGGGSSVEVVDNLTSTSTTAALSANQGKILNESKADKSEIPTKTSQLENNSGYLTSHQDISGKLDKSVYNEDKPTFATKDDLKAKLDKSVYEFDKPTYVTYDALREKNYASRTELDAKQDTLNSGVNIKTINDQSILGEGNIVVQSKIDVDTDLSLISTNPVLNQAVTKELNNKPETRILTQSEYDLLTPEEKNKNIFYVISDSKNNYATVEYVDNLILGIEREINEIRTMI